LPKNSTGLRIEWFKISIKISKPHRKSSSVIDLCKGYYIVLLKGHTTPPYMTSQIMYSKTITRQFEGFG